MHVRIVNRGGKVKTPLVMRRRVFPFVKSREIAENLVGQQLQPFPQVLDEPIHCQGLSIMQSVEPRPQCGRMLDQLRFRCN